MHSHSTPRNIVVTLVALVAMIAASSAQAYTQPATQPGLGSGQTSTAPAIRALHMRGEALNARYGLGSGSTSAAIRALNVRSEAMNARYVAQAPAVTSDTSPFSWGDFGIGAGAALGGIALLLLAVTAGRIRRTVVA